MARLTNWENQIGRRLRLRDLHVLFVVAERGSMAKAAAELGISQPSVSDVVANLEHTLGVRLFDRSPHGVEPTTYGHALLKRGLAAFRAICSVFVLAARIIFRVCAAVSAAMASRLCSRAFRRKLSGFFGGYSASAILGFISDKPLSWPASSSSDAISASRMSRMFGSQPNSVAACLGHWPQPPRGR